MSNTARYSLGRASSLQTPGWRRPAPTRSRPAGLHRSVSSVGGSAVHRAPPPAPPTRPTRGWQRLPAPGHAGRNWGGTREVWGARGMLSRTGMLRRHPLRHAPLQPNAASPSPPAQRPAAPSAAQWKFPSGASAGASGDQQTSLDPGRSWGAASSAQPSRRSEPPRAAERDNVEQHGSGITCPSAPCPSPPGCLIPCVFFQAPLPSFEWALPAQPRNLPLSGTADERRDKFRKKSLCGSEEKHSGLGNPSCSQAV